MTIKQAIGEALKGGYKRDNYGRLSKKKIFLDPLFWQSLFGLNVVDDNSGMTILEHNEWLKNNPQYTDVAAWGFQGKEYKWKYKWHLFIDHLAEGKDAESYFEKL